MTDGEIAARAAGFALPVLAAPLAIKALRPLFTHFFREGVELFSRDILSEADARSVGGLMTSLNVAAALVAWLTLFTCDTFGQPPLLLAAIAVAGLGLAFLITMLIVRSNVEVTGRDATWVSLISFAGGNLPLFVVIAGGLGFMTVL